MTTSGNPIPDKVTSITDRPPVHRAYLGDGVYASYDGTGVTLTTDRAVPGKPGHVQTHWVFLEPAVYEALRRFSESLGGDHRG